jgi:hypothetical protein
MADFENQPDMPEKNGEKKTKKLRFFPSPVSPLFSLRGTRLSDPRAKLLLPCTW